MVTASKGHEAALKRRLLVMALDLKPRHLRNHLGLDPPLVSFVLGGERKLSPKERAKFMGLIRKRIDDLFG